METIGIIAGTPVDTELGVDFIESKGLKAIGYQTASSQKEQHELQLLYKDRLYQIVIETILQAKREGIEKFFVYCNSLSAAVDMDKLARETDAFLVTPFTVYKDIAKDYSKLLILAANGQACAKIESILFETNKDLTVWSISALPLVGEIENKNPEEEIFNRLHLGKLLAWAEANDFDGILLGCTHFPYIKDKLLINTRIPIIDPADKMLETLMM